MYSVGGQTSGLKIIDSDMLEINLSTFKHRYIEVKNRALMPNLSNMKCCMIFYSSRFEHTPHEGDPASVSYKRIAKEPNWSVAEHNIKHEGIYFFGGQDARSQAQNVLIVLTFHINVNGVISRSYTRPETLG